MSNYGERAYFDLVGLGLASKEYGQQWLTHYDMYTLASYTRRINNPPLRHVPTSIPRTHFGQRVKAVQAMEIMFDDETSQACRAAERHLLDSLDPSMLNDSRIASPIVIMAGRTACGLIKSSGDPTCYGLQDVPELSLVRGAWHDVVGPQILNDGFADDSAFTIPLDTIDAFKPIRFSHFVLPVSERRSLQAVGRHPIAYAQVADTGQKAVDHLVAEALKDATCLPIPTS